MFRFNKDNHIILLQNTWLACDLFFFKFSRNFLSLHSISKNHVLTVRKQFKLLQCCIAITYYCFMPEARVVVTKLFDYLRNHDVH